jgi:hypothetical protein
MFDSEEPSFVCLLPKGSIMRLENGGDEVALAMQGQLPDRRGGDLACPAFVMTTCNNDVIMAFITSKRSHRLLQFVLGFRTFFSYKHYNTNIQQLWVKTIPTLTCILRPLVSQRKQSR